MYADGTTESTTYTTSENNGKKYINLALGNGLTQAFELGTLNETKMTWLLETLNDQYDEGGVTKTAAKSIYRIEFQK